MTGPATEVPAPATGVHLGRTRQGPVTLRLFRQDGTRIAVLSSIAPVQLLALRAIAAGIPVSFVSERPQFWGPLAVQNAEVYFDPPGSTPPAALVVDDSRAADPAALGAVAPWQCRIELRTPWTAGDVLALTNADAVIVGSVDAEIVSGLRSGFGLSRGDAGALTTLDAASVGIVHRGAVRYVTLNPTPGELAVLGRAR